MLQKMRVLDLTDDHGFFCGRLLGDLGADVIKIEKPGGDASRRHAPFLGDVPDDQASLYWFAYNMNKRGITLDLGIPDGKAIFKKLARTADVIVESFAPGHVDELGLGYQVISKIKPGIIMVSITPFGQGGPYQGYTTCDLVSQAMAGLMYTTGDPDRPPLRIGVPQAFVISGGSAAMAAMVAYYHRETTGQGQYVDVSIHSSVAYALANILPTWELNKFIMKRQGNYQAGRAKGFRQRTLMRCKDGYVAFHIFGGTFGRKTNEGITQWMDSEGAAPPSMKNMDWNKLDMIRAGKDLQDEFEGAISKFFLTHTKAELYQGALERGIMLAPAYDAEDISKDSQLKSRDFWLQIEGPDAGSTVTSPGFFIKASETPCQLQRRAPQAGEHNLEIYEGDLGFSREEVIELREAGVI
jgi:crotonobetainyl-CoA:carnitine CoA-transferase CaiB-like acyl-CoA transferase